METNGSNLFFFFFLLWFWCLGHVKDVDHLRHPRGNRAHFITPHAGKPHCNDSCLSCKNSVSLQLSSGKQNKVLPALSFPSDLVLVATTVRDHQHIDVVVTFLPDWRKSSKRTWLNQCLPQPSGREWVGHSGSRGVSDPDWGLRKTESLDCSHLQQIPHEKKMFLWPPTF